jgi:hypothetical protein
LHVRLPPLVLPKVPGLRVGRQPVLQYILHRYLAVALGYSLLHGDERDVLDLEDITCNLTLSGHLRFSPNAAM